jgi:hypothetical protein
MKSTPEYRNGLPTAEDPVGLYRIRPRNMPDFLLCKVETCPGEPERFWVKVMIDDENPMFGGLQFEVWRNEISKLRDNLQTGDWGDVATLPLKREDF